MDSFKDRQTEGAGQVNGVGAGGEAQANIPLLRSYDKRDWSRLASDGSDVRGERMVRSDTLGLFHSRLFSLVPHIT